LVQKDVALFGFVRLWEKRPILNGGSLLVIEWDEKTVDKRNFREMPLKSSTELESINW
jgi:hypothetical protein